MYVLHAVGIYTCCNYALKQYKVGKINAKNSLLKTYVSLPIKTRPEPTNKDDSSPFLVLLRETITHHDMYALIPWNIVATIIELPCGTNRKVLSTKQIRK